MEYFICVVICCESSVSANASMEGWEYAGLTLLINCLNYSVITLLWLCVRVLSCVSPCSVKYGLNTSIRGVVTVLRWSFMKNKTISIPCNPTDYHRSQPVCLPPTFSLISDRFTLRDYILLFLWGRSGDGNMGAGSNRPWLNCVAHGLLHGQRINSLFLTLTIQWVYILQGSC